MSLRFGSSMSTAAGFLSLNSIATPFPEHNQCYDPLQGLNHGPSPCRASELEQSRLRSTLRSPPLSPVGATSRQWRFPEQRFLCWNRRPHRCYHLRLHPPPPLLLSYPCGSSAPGPRPSGLQALGRAQCCASTTPPAAKCPRATTDNRSFCRPRSPRPERPRSGGVTVVVASSGSSATGPVGRSARIRAPVLRSGRHGHSPGVGIEAFDNRAVRELPPPAAAVGVACGQGIARRGRPIRRGWCRAAR